MIKNTITAGILYRHSILENNDTIDNKDRILEVAFSSSQPVERFFGIEILDHGTDSISLDWLQSGNAPLLLDHDQTKQIGVVESAAVGEDGKARAKIRFSKNKLADSIYQDVLDGIRKNISVGYRYMKDGVTLEEEGKEGQPDIYRIKLWKPLEISIVSIPADSSVGVGRMSESENNQLTIFKVSGNNMQNTKNTEVKKDKTEIVGLNPETIRKDETMRVSEILALGDRHNMRDIAMSYIKDGKNIDSFRAYVLENLSNAETIKTIPQNTSETTAIGMSNKETRDFSIIKAIRASMTGNWGDAGLEREASNETAKKLGREPSSFFVPLDVTVRTSQNYNKRTLEKLTNIAGGYLVDTDYMASSFIEMLRNKMLVKQMGARVMSGLHGDVAIPKQTGGATTYWVSEGGAPDASEQRFGQVTLTPRSVAAFTDFTRKLVLQSSPDIESLVRNDLATVLALEIDRVAIEGTGHGPEPAGILATAGIGEIPIDVDNPDDENALSWGKIVDLESQIATQNADIGTLGYLCNAAMRGILKQKEKSEGTAQFLWEERGEAGFGMLNGYKVGTTNQMPPNALLFGNFADLIIGQWGVMDVLVDPYTLGTSGGIRIRVMQDVDIAVRHAESFAVAKGA